ncbi:hypothetical protein IWW42_001769 [Coemansia sp. RSA 1085]|nr:hypothetical protein IWW42_001769 [Coemansia sp. RSA 1085]
MDIPIDLTSGPLPTVSSRALNTFTIVKFSASATISMAAFIYGLALVYVQPRVWHSPIVRIVIVAQVINSLRFVFRLIAIFADVNADFGCRVLLFLNNVFSILPVNLCIYCVVYLQMVIIHKVSPQKRWPRIVTLSIATAVSVIPTSWFLFWPAHRVNAKSFCHLSRITNYKFYHFLIATVFIWSYLPGFIGMLSILCIVMHIIRTRRKTRQVLQESNEAYGPSRDMQRPVGDNMLHRTIINIIWFPIVPIISLWFNVVLISVVYYKRRTYMWLEYINVVLLGLQSIFLAVALAVNPIARSAAAEYWHKRQQQKYALLETEVARTISSFGLPPVHSRGMVAESEIECDL